MTQRDKKCKLGIVTQFEPKSIDSLRTKVWMFEKTLYIHNGGTVFSKTGESTTKDYRYFRVIEINFVRNVAILNTHR